MGKLPLMLAAADLAFVGGSLVKIGGHNLLEPAALGKPSDRPPPTSTSATSPASWWRRGGGRRGGGCRCLGDKVNALLGDAGARRQMGEQARAVVLRNQGALARALSHCLAALENDQRGGLGGHPPYSPVVPSVNRRRQSGPLSFMLCPLS